nr:putative reverse transcriptase domain-containing protein [Tanacetum cinerariifolium]
TAYNWDTPETEFSEDLRSTFAKNCLLICGDRTHALDERLINNRRPRNRRCEDEDEESEENPFGDGSDEQSVLRPRRNQREDNRCWESGMRVNILDFDGDTLNPEGFIDCLAAVEEVFEFKEEALPPDLPDFLNLSSECKKTGKRHIFADPEDNDDDVAYDDYEAALVYDDEPGYEEEYVSGDVGVNLVASPSCLTPKADGSCDNLIAEEAIQKLGLKTKNRPKPYKLQWLKKGGEETVSKRVHVPFSIGTTYKDNVWCDMVAMDACHLLLGRPWEYDRDITHNGKTNTYSFLFGFKDELEVGDDIFVLIGKEVVEDSEIPKAMIPLLEEFIDVFTDEMSPGEHEELRRQVGELISKGHIRKSMRPCAIPTFLSPKKGGTWRMCVDSRAINKITMRPGDEWKTTFKTTEGLYEWLVMPFGLSNAPRYVVSGDGIRVGESKVAAVEEWPTPTTITKVQSFHGLASFYRRFIPNFSAIMAPLTNCMKGKSFMLTDEAELAFQVVKEKLTTTPILEFVLFTDHDSLRHIRTQDKVSHKHGCWLAFLEKFTFLVKHKTGVSNQAVDALSRRNSLLVTMQVPVPGLDVIRDMVTVDPYFLVVLQVVQSGDKTDFVLHDGFLFKGNQLCIPDSSLRLKIIKEFHSEGHVGRDRTLQLVQASYFWPTMRKEVDRYVKRTLFLWS